MTREQMKRAKKNKELKAQISYYLTKADYTKKELAKELGMCEATLYNKLRSPDSFTLGEFRELLFIMGADDSLRLLLI